MNENAIENLINGFGVMTEMWIICYKSFVEHGMTEAQATKHTQAFMESIIKVVTGK